MPLLDDITIGRYQAKCSFVHSLDPRTKGICTILLMVAAFGISTFIGLGVGVLLTVLLVLMAKSGLKDLGRNFKAFIWLFALTFALHLIFSPPGEKVLIPGLGIEVGREGLNRGIFYSGRIALLLIYSYLFMAATAPMEIADGLEKSLKPLKKLGFPAHETALAISIALRFVPTLLDETKRIRDAQLCRGAKLEGNLPAKVKGFSAMLIPLFASALRRADVLALAMEARGYRGGGGRTSFIELKFRMRDLTALLFTIGITAGLYAL